MTHSVKIGLNGSLFSALFNEDLPTLKELLENGMDLMQDPSVVIIQLAKTKSKELLSFVKESGFDITQEDGKLIKAHIKKKHEEIVELLINGITVNSEIRKECFELSVNKDSPKMCQLFREGIDIEDIKNTLFIKSARVGYLESVKYLIIEENVNAQDMLLDHIENNVQLWIDDYYKRKNLNDKLSLSLNEKTNETSSQENKRQKI